MSGREQAAETAQCNDPESRVQAVHQALAESAGIYDLSDDEAAHFLRVFDAAFPPADSP